MIKELIGSKLVSFNNDGFSVLFKNGEVRNFVFEEDEGACCGFNELETELLISTEELERNPVITNIENEDISVPYECDKIKITFFGEYKPIAKIDSLSSSGSGYGYGACVTLICKQTNEKEVITQW